MKKLPFASLDFYIPKQHTIKQARMVELVDTLVSGTSAFSGMEVRVFFRAGILTILEKKARLDNIIPCSSAGRASGC